MKIKVIGCGEAFDPQYGNNSFLLTLSQKSTFLIDCGYQIPERLWKNKDHSHIEAIYLTHSHADHSFGLPPLLTKYRIDQRKKPLYLIGHPSLEGFVKQICRLGYPNLLKKLSFELNFLPISPRSPLSFKGLNLTVAKSHHSVNNQSLKITTPKGKTVAFSGDGQISQATEKLYSEIDLLFHEVYTKSQFIPGHTTLIDLKNLVTRQNIKKTVISHQAQAQRPLIHRALQQNLYKSLNISSARPNQILSL